jgi:hypothetical protein
MGNPNWVSGKSGNPNGRPAGSRNKRTEELFLRLENRGDTDCGEFLSSIVSNQAEPKELRIQAAGLLLPYKYSKMGTTPVPPALIFIEQALNLPKPTSIHQATQNIAYLSELKATGQIDQAWGDNLIADQTRILDALVEDAKLMLAQGGPAEQTIHISGGLPALPGTSIEMPRLNGHSIGHDFLAPTPPPIESTPAQADATEAKVQEP